MQLTNDIVSSVLANRSTTSTGSHWIADCPFCGKAKHLYVQTKTDKTNNRGQNVSFFFQCKKCDERGSIYRLLRALGRQDLIEKSTFIDIAQIEKTITDKVFDDSIVYHESPSKSLPLGFVRSTSSNPIAYLTGRGFVDEMYNHYKVGTARILPRDKNYVFFVITEDGRNVGYVGRVMLSKQQIDLQSASGNRILRYNNSSMTEFANLLYGYDEIQSNTHTVIIVEGIFDKIAIDAGLNLFYLDSIKCVASFGKTVSPQQIAKLKHKGIKNILLMFDLDATEDSKRIGFQLQRFFNVGLVFCPKKDPGELDRAEIASTFNQILSPSKFMVERVQKRIIA